MSERFYYLSQYIGNGTKPNPFRAIGLDVPGAGAIDLRRYPSEGAGYALLSSPLELFDQRLIPLTDDKSKELSLVTQNILKNKLTVNFDHITLDEIIGRLLVNPPLNRWNALSPSRESGSHEIWIAGELFWQKPYTFGPQGEIIDPSDNFTRANETPLAGNWLRLTGSTGNINLSSNSVVASAVGDKVYIYSGAVSSADQYSQITLGTLGADADAAAAVRASNGLNGYFAATYDPGEGIFKLVSGTYTLIGTVTTSNFVTGDICRIEAQGSTLRYYKNGTQQTGSPMTDTSITAVGGSGIFIYETGLSLTFWSGGDLAGTASSTTRDIRTTGVAASTPSSTTRDLRTTGTGTDNLAVPLTILLGNASNTTRDLRITGGTPGNSSNVTRDIRVSGVSAGAISESFTVPATILLSPSTSTTRDIRIFGEAANALVTRDIRITSQQTTNITRDLRITGTIQTPSSTTRDIRVSGQATSATDRDIRITGAVNPPSLTSRDLRIAGALPYVAITVTYRSVFLTDETTRDIRITGRIDTNIPRDIRITGQSVSSIARDIKTVGEFQTNRSNDLRITGQNTSSINRDLRIVGQATNSTATDIRVNGQLAQNVTRDLRITGQLSSNTIRDLRITGQLSSNTIRDIKTFGEVQTFTTRDLRAFAQGETSVSRDLKLSSIGDTSVTRELSMVSEIANETTRDLRIFGEVQVQASWDIRISGESIVSSTTRDLRIFAVAPSDVTRDLRITGSTATLTSVDHDIRVSGRPVFIARPDGDIVTDDWIAVPGGTLASTIDEVVPDRSDYMKSPTSPVAVKTAEVTLSNVTAPASDDFHIVRYQIAAVQPPSQIQLTVSLVQGTTVIASWVHVGLTSTPTTFVQTLTNPQAAVITNYDDLRLRFSAAPISTEVTFDGQTTSLRTSTSDPHSFVHTPTGTLAGVALVASHGNTTTDKWGTVTYGGTAMTRLETSSTSSGGGGNLGLSAVWFLGQNVPQGAQTVSIDYTGFDDDDCLFTLVGITALGNLEAIDIDKITDTNAANPSLTMQTTGRHSITVATLLSATSAPSNFTPNGGTTVYGSFDGGSYSVLNLGQTTPGTSNFTIGGTLSADWHCMVAVTIAKVI